MCRLACTLDLIFVDALCKVGHFVPERVQHKSMVICIHIQIILHRLHHTNTPEDWSVMEFR
jgi:hypothetical protein